MKIRVLHQRNTLAQSKLWRFLQRALLVAGFFGVGFSASAYVSCYVYQAYEGWRFDRALARKQVAPTGVIPSVRAVAASGAPETGAISLIGRITIPRLGISAMVKEGVDDRTLGLAVGHIPRTALPGETGNAGFAAHRDNLFRNLKGVARDDEISVTTIDKTYVYRVVSFRVVEPENVAVLSPSPGEKSLTLVTCYPFYFVGHAPKRFVVRAVQVAAIAAVEPDTRSTDALPLVD